MFRSRRLVSILLPLLLSVLVLSGCALTQPRDTEPPLASDASNAVVQRVVATVEARVEQRLVAAERNADVLNTDAIIAQVLDRLSTPVAATDQAVPINYDDTLAAGDAELEQTLIDLYHRTNPAVVYIIVPPWHRQRLRLRRQRPHRHQQSCGRWRTTTMRSCLPMASAVAPPWWARMSTAIWPC